MENTQTQLVNSTKTPFMFRAGSAFKFLWFGLLVSLAGDHLNRVGLIWYVNQNFGGVKGEMGFGFAMSIPMAIVGIFAGVIVDRFNRNTLLYTTDFVRAGVVGLMAVLLLLFTPNLFLISAFSVVLGVAGLLFNPCVQSMMPDLAGGDQQQMIKMDAWILGTITTFSVFGPALAGLLAPFLPISVILGIDAVSFVISACMIVMMNRQLRKQGVEVNVPAPKRKNILLDAKDSLAYIFKHPVLGPQFSVFPILEAVTYSIPFLLPNLIQVTLGGDSKMYGLFLGVWASGRVVAMSIFPKTSLTRKRGLVFSANLFVQGIAIALIGFAPNQWMMLAGFFLLGLPAGAAMLSMSSYIQTEMPREMRGRIFAGMSSLSMMLVPLGPLVLGALSQVLGVQQALLCTTGFLILGGLYISSRRAIREIQ